MFGKMRLLVGCRSGMTVKFASKFHHGNPFVRGLLFAGSAAPFKGRAAVRRWCGIGCMRSPSESAALDARLRDAPWGLAHSACVCAGIAQERFPCVARCMDAPRTFLRRRSEVMHSARVVRRPVEAGTFGAHLRSTVHCSPRALRRAKEAGKLHRFAALAPHSLLCIHLFARCYSSTSRHSKRVDARFARRTVYRPPSGELVMVLMR